jgi:uncharacterized membrane protein SirB2
MIFIGTIILIISGFVLRSYAWIIPQFSMSQWMTKKYVHYFITADNQRTEQIGTGRMI